MGWHIGMTEEEMREFAGMNGASCTLSNAKKAMSPTTTTEDSSTVSKEDTMPDDKPPPVETVIVHSSPQETWSNTACPLPPNSPPPPPPPDVDYIYHLCQKSKWDEAVESKLPYFPPTYMKDGKFTRASVYKEDIVGVANIYYKDTPGKWIVLEIDCKLLYSLGIPILAQEAPESKLTGEPVKCLQIFGGIATSLPLIHKIYPVFRKSTTGEFVKLLGPVPSSGAKNESPPTRESKVHATETETVKPTETHEQPQRTKEGKKKGLFGLLKKGAPNKELKA